MPPRQRVREPGEDRPRVVYVSYDGAGEPLGRSQVLAYLRRLAASCEIALVSFEKDHASRAETRALLAEAGITWHPLSYHKRPPVLSTLWDVLAGAHAVRRACRAIDADVVHVRSDVPALIALISVWPRRRRWRLLFDIRGFWADERVAGGIWPAGGLLYRFARRCERWFYGAADAVVTLTAASVPQIREWLDGRDIPVVVIPTCAEVERYGAPEPRREGPRAIWCGSIGSFYRFDLAPRFAAALGLPLTVLTRQLEGARAELAGMDADVREVPHSDVWAELRPGDIGMCFYLDGFANLARAPTRFAEHLAAGMVVAVTPGIGDLDAIVASEQVGVTIADTTDAGIAHAAAQALSVAANPGVQDRARRLAHLLYSVDEGTSTYLGLYRWLCEGRPLADIGFEAKLREGAARATPGPGLPPLAP